MAENQPEKSASPDLVGQTIGDYTLLRTLGSGGMADVFLAEQNSLKRKVAFKVLKPELGKDAAYVQRFVREAQAAAALTQSSIVQIYEVGNIGGVHFIAQEYVPGRNLRQYLNRHGAVETPMALNVLRQTAMALQKAGEMGVTHRDIKPENIMISPSGEVKVTDFGLARLSNESVRMDLTQIGVTMGTPLYMSPEQVEGKPVDPRSDIYSLGITAFHMLAGFAPFEGDTALAVALKHVNSPLPDLQQIRPDLPEDLSKLIRKMAAKKPEERIQNASELLRELRKVKVESDFDFDSLAEKLAATANTSGEFQLSGNTAKLAVTRQLQSVMQGHIKSWWRSPLVVASLLGLCLLGLAAGVAFARLNPPFDPFSTEYKPEQRIAREKDVVEQYRAAYWGRDPEFFEAVMSYFPLEQASADSRNKTLLYHRFAKQRLAEIYLAGAEPRLDKAFTYFNDLYLCDDQPEFQAAGAAGLAIICDDFQEEDQARRFLMKLEPNIDLLNETLRRMVTPLLEKYRYDLRVP
ncbi:MAG: serine/threonine-protein kinase [Planctomycetota bacterium]